MPPNPSTAPEFSIITICRNEAHGIGRTCESVISQTHSNYEWIVIDGASSDGTLEALNHYRSHISHLISEPDGGIYEAMNKGINLARGSYLVFMNGGDCFASKEVIAWVAQAPMVDLIYGQLLLDHHSGQLLEQAEKINRDYLLKSMFYHQASFIHRGLFDRLGLYDTSYRIAGDYDFFCRTLVDERADHHYIPKPFAIFERGGISSQDDQRGLRKRENHRVRMRYFPEYRHSAKAWRQRLRNIFTRESGS